VPDPGGFCGPVVDNAASRLSLIVSSPKLVATVVDGGGAGMRRALHGAAEVR